MIYRTTKDCVSDLQERRVSSCELTEAAIARIEAHDEALNAVVVRDFERARAAADEADAALARGEQKPLLGVPMTVKESYNVAGLPTTWGLEAAKTSAAAEDAVTVRRLKKAGAIILGKTNVPVMLADWQSNNPVYGRTNNPWDVTRTPGGSSGGAAAALAAGYVPLELGSDIGGSLRIPASFCGVFAHKPSFDLVPHRGHIPPGAPQLSVANKIDLAVCGPMSRSAGDLMLALDVLSGPDDAEAVAYRLDLAPPRHANLEAYRVLLIDEHPLVPTSAEVRAQMQTLAEKLERAGCEVGRSSEVLPDLSLLGITYIKLLMAFLAADMPEERYRATLERAAALAGDEPELESAVLRGMTMSHRDWIHTDRIRTGMAHRWRTFFADWDVLLCPVVPIPAFPHDDGPPHARTSLIDGIRVPYLHLSLWISVATLTGLPATAMPVGLSADGLPVGVQIIGPYLQDRTTIGFAALMEREFGGFARPPGY